MLELVLRDNFGFGDMEIDLKRSLNEKLTSRFLCIYTSQLLFHSFLKKLNVVINKIREKFIQMNTNR